MELWKNFSLDFQMKAALIFLVFFVGTSYQQAYYPYWPAVPQYYYYHHAPLGYSIPAAPMAQARLSADMVTFYKIHARSYDRVRHFQESSYTQSEKNRELNNLNELI